MSIPISSQRAVQKLVNLAPELLDSPFYALAYSQAKRLSVGNSLGLAFIGADNAQVEAVLRDRKEWRGAGRAILLNVGAIRRLNKADASFEKHLNSIALHEVCHHLPARPPIDWPEIPGGIPQKLFEAANNRTKRELEAAASPDRQPWHGHGFTFLRICCHMVWRAQQIDIPLCLHSIAGGAQYGLSDFSDYLRAIGNEPSRLRNEKFSLICRMPAPAWFADVWGRDIDRYTRWNLRTKQRNDANVDHK